MFEALASGADGINANWTTVIAIGTLLLGTTSTTAVALINWLGNRGKNRGDATKSIVEAAAGLLTPYATALDMANNQLKLLAEQDRQKANELRSLRAHNRKLEIRVDELTEIQTRTTTRLEICQHKLEVYEQQFGPLTLSG